MKTCETCPNDLVCHDFGECKQPSAPDYGEPWQIGIMGFPQAVTNSQGKIMAGNSAVARAVACVNACAGIPDPAAHMAAMREAIKTLVDLCERAMTVIQSDYPDTADMDDFVTDFDCTRQELQPFLK
jgi:hypothetical protein